MRKTKVGFGFVVLLAVGCGGAVDNPYEPCGSGDICSDNTICSVSTLPAASYTGTFCSNPCNTDADCAAAPSGFDPVCFQTSSGGLCYIGCGTSNDCPPGQACGAASDSTGANVQICIP